MRANEPEVELLVFDEPVGNSVDCVGPYSGSDHWHCLILSMLLDYP
jgi:hypothetical protein